MPALSRFPPELADTNTSTQITNKEPLPRRDTSIYHLPEELLTKIMLLSRTDTRDHLIGGKSYRDGESGARDKRAKPHTRR